MSSYLNAIVVTVIVCHVVTVFSHGSESTRRYVRLLCALVTLLTLAAPIKYVVNSAGEIILGITGFFSTSDSGTVLYGEENDAASLAYVIMSAVSDKFGIDRQNVRITIVVDDGGNLSEIQLYLKSTAYTDRERVREALLSEFEIPVYVFAEG